MRLYSSSQPISFLLNFVQETCIKIFLSPLASGPGGGACALFGNKPIPVNEGDGAKSNGEIEFSDVDFEEGIEGAGEVDDEDDEATQKRDDSDVMSRQEVRARCGSGSIGKP